MGISHVFGLRFEFFSFLMFYDFSCFSHLPFDHSVCSTAFWETLSSKFYCFISGYTWAGPCHNIHNLPANQTFSLTANPIAKQSRNSISLLFLDFEPTEAENFLTQRKRAKRWSQKCDAMRLFTCYASSSTPRELQSDEALGFHIKTLRDIHQCDFLMFASLNFSPQKVLCLKMSWNQPSLSMKESHSRLNPIEFSLLWIGSRWKLEMWNSSLCDL